jgi:O-methyltransferase
VSIRTKNCLNILSQEKLYTVPGDLIELGVARGDTTFPMANFMAEIMPEKKLYACDTFSGLPYDDSMECENKWKKGDLNLGNAFKAIYAARRDRNIIMVEGMVEDTLMQKLGGCRFCVAWIDMDTYQPTSFAYKFLEDRINPGGVIGFHDYQYVNTPGIAKVVDSELDAKKFEQIGEIEANCVFFRKKQK